MRKMYFLKTRYSNNHFSLLRRSHPEPTKGSFKPSKLWGPMCPTTQPIYKIRPMLSSSLFSTTTEPENPSLLLTFSHLHVNGIEPKLKNKLHHLLPYHLSFPKVSFLWNFSWAHLILQAFLLV